MLGLACGARSTTSRCHFQSETSIAELGREGADFVAVARVGDGGIALWSGASGLFARPIDNRGVPTGDAARILSRCEGGLDAAEYGERILVACQHGGDEHSVELLSLTTALRTRQLAHWPTETDAGRGISVAASPEVIAVFWSNGIRGHEKIWVGRVQGSNVVPPDTLVTTLESAIEPDALFHAGALTVTWAEMHAEGSAQHSGNVVLYDGHGAPTVVSPVHCVSPSPQLVADSLGLIVSFRDVRAPDPRAGLFLVRDKNHEAPARVARANAIGAQSMSRCTRGLFAAAPRTFRDDALVGVSRISPGLERIGGEVQIYQTQSDLALVDTACAPDGLLALFADEAHERTRVPSLRSTRLVCDEDAN